MFECYLFTEVLSFPLYHYVCILDLSTTSVDEISEVKGQTPLMAALFGFQLI